MDAACLFTVFGSSCEQVKSTLAYSSWLLLLLLPFDADVPIFFYQSHSNDMAINTSVVPDSF